MITENISDQHEHEHEQPLAVCLLSGGMDSTVLAYQTALQGYRLHCLSFDYGQRHKKEIAFAMITASKLRAKHDTIDLSSVGKLLTGSALTDPSQRVPEGHYEASNMAITVVPNRNALMLAAAYSVAVAEGAVRVLFAAHAGDHAIYPDCREAFITQLWQTFAIGNQGMSRRADGRLPHVRSPFVLMSKADICRQGRLMHVPFEDTWSCYNDHEFHCGACGTCTERVEAFRIARVDDPTVYEFAGLQKYEELHAAGKVQ